MLSILIEKTERSDTTNLQSSIFNSGLSGLGITRVNRLDSGPASSPEGIGFLGMTLCKPAAGSIAMPQYPNIVLFPYVFFEHLNLLYETTPKWHSFFFDQTGRFFGRRLG
jgi:hypothetical protein